ncbi:MFS general substrate transporter [Hymenopellis radicata]|nr:MFS general substrate transporter [Hymenopellis radicata]
MLEAESRTSSPSAGELSEKERLRERKAVRKLDYAVLPIMTMFYLLSFLDRANIGNARVAGLQKDLGLTDHQYQICVTVLFVPYIFAELPANLLLRKIGPGLLMPTLLTIWGVIVTLQGLVTSYAGLVTVRAVLGLVEGPMFPGIVLFLSGFYTRAELSLRVAVFFSSASLSGAFSGLLAAAIMNMDGVGNKPGWAWIFILEGLFSVCVGIAGFFLVPSTPRDVLFLTEEEKDILVRRLEVDRPSINPADHFSFKEVFRSVLSPHVIMVFICFYMIGTTLYGLGLFLPSLVNQLGFSPVKSQLLSVGPFAAGFFVTLISAFFSDRYNARAIPTAMISALAVIGFSMYLRAENKYVAYGSMFFCVPGVYATAPVVSAWMSNNSEPYYRRATSIAVGFIATNSVKPNHKPRDASLTIVFKGGITSTWLYPTKEGPKFTRTTILNLVFSTLIIVGAGLNAVYLTRLNARKQKDRAKILAPYLESGDVKGDGGMRAWMELGDRHPDFRYTI